MVLLSCWSAADRWIRGRGSLRIANTQRHAVDRDDDTVLCECNSKDSTNLSLPGPMFFVTVRDARALPQAYPSEVRRSSSYGQCPRQGIHYARLEDTPGVCPVKDCLDAFQVFREPLGDLADRAFFPPITVTTFAFYVLLPPSSSCSIWATLGPSI